MKNLETGRKGEESACNYLEKQGHTIIARNWRNSHQEIDIISFDCQGLHIVEVKTRKAPAMVEPLKNVNRKKMLNLTKAANAFLHSNLRKSIPDNDFEIFFDLVSVILDGEKADIRYFPSAYLPMHI